MLVGHRIQLVAEIKGLSGSVEFEQWIIPGKPIYTYQATWQLGKVFHIPDFDFKGRRDLNFCWVDKGTKEVVYEIIVNGKLYSAKAKFNVLAPESKTTTETRSVTVDTNFELYSNKSSLHFGNTNSQDQENPAGFSTTLGITFNRTTDLKSLPPYFANGNEMKYLQIVNTYFRLKRTEGWYKDEYIGLDVLPNATDWPYTTLKPNNPDVAGDAPAFPLFGYSERGFSEVELRYGSFEMYTMFKPSGTGSIWVPLHKVDWDWSGKAIYDDVTGQWIGTGTNKPNPISSEITEHPEWTKTVFENVMRVKE